MRGAPHRLLFRQITRSTEHDDCRVLLELHASIRRLASVITFYSLGIVVSDDRA